FSRSTHTDNLGPGLFLSRCQPSGLCAEERIYTHPNNGTIRFAYAAHGVEQIVAIADAVRFDRFNVMTRRSDGAWQGQEVVAFDNNNDGGFTLTVHGAQGRWWATAHNTRTGMVVFQRGADGQWNRTGLLPRLDAARPLQAVAGRSLTLALANRRFSEQNDFAGEDFTRGVAERVLRTGQIAVIDGRYLKRTTGAKPAFANATLGAGDATHGRDPCYWHQTYYPVSLDTYGYRALQIDGTVTIPAGQCIDVDRITGSGTLVLAGTENKPIMLRTQTFAPDVKIRATWTFIVTLPNRTLRSDISHTAVFGSRGMTLDHVSVARTPRHGQPTTDAEVSHSLDFSNTTGVARYNVTVRDSYFANIAGSMFTFDGSTNAVFERVTFENVERHGVVIWNNGMNDSRLTMRDVSFVNPGAAVAARSLTSEARSQLSLDLLGLSEAARRKIRERPEFPIDLTNVTIETTHQINNDAPPAIFLQTAVGTSRGISVHNSIGDAIHFDNSGLYELADSV
ncbi:MAG TPA: hypothetical protein PLF40_30440, partial [Kofleriaceae bacterium]|nr:hypothetical protein [Kofleriaceae bacterium]